MTVQSPGLQATTQETSRVLKRGTLETFFFSFFYDEAQTQPVSPIDPATQPNFRILDPSGSLLQDGIAVPAAAPGVWRVAWFVPVNAELTNVHHRYRIQTTMVDANFRQFETSFEFDVVETAVPAQKPELQQLLTFVGQGTRAHFHNTVRPDYLQARVMARGQDNKPMFIANWVYPVPANPGPGTIYEVPIGTGYTYYIDTPTFPAPGEYTVVWFVRDFPLSENEMEMQNIEVVNTSVLQLMTKLRMFIDKLQKKLGIVYAYRNEEIIAYLNQGLGTINQGVPPTYYTFTNLPTPLESLLITSSLYWGLIAQRILYGETNFDFCVDLDTLLPTRRGLIRAKSLVADAGKILRKNISKQLIYGDEEMLFSTICTLFSSETRVKDIISRLNLNTSSVALGGVFSRFRLNKFKSFNKLDNPVWDIPKFEDHLAKNYGMFYDLEEGSYETEHELLTPYGFSKPERVWHLKDKQVYRVENELGYELIATGNHPILVLDSDTFEVSWKDLDKIEIGDLVALNNSPIKEDEDWEVSLEDNVKAVFDTNTCTTKSPYTLPEKMSPELARLCGYLIADGCLTCYDNITFANTEQNIIDDFNFCCKEVFGQEASYIDSYGSVESPTHLGGTRPVHYYKLNGVEIRRFFFTLGMGYEKANKKRIPEIILRSPKKIAKEFIRGFFEGDGCFAITDLIFSSSSQDLLSDLQQLFLRFGIISAKWNPTDEVVGKVSVRGLSMVTYAKEIGFLFKGKDFQEKSIYYPQREALNPEILKGLIGIRKHLGLNCKGWKATDDGKRRYDIYWDHNAKLAKHITWDHVEDWFKDKGETVRFLNKEVWNRIHLLLDTRFLWKKVRKIEKLDRRDVIDPSFASQGNPLDHAFVTNGLITHNTGQTVSIGYNPGADLDGMIDRLNTAVEAQLRKTKEGIVRASSSVGFIATRPARFRSGLLFKVGDINGTQTGNSIYQMLASYGIPVD